MQRFMLATGAFLVGSSLAGCGGAIEQDVLREGDERGAFSTPPSGGSGAAGSDSPLNIPGGGAVDSPKYGGTSSCAPPLAWKWDGGLSATYELSSIRDCGTYVWKEFGRDHKERAYCTSTLGSGGVTAHAIRAAAEHPDVVAALRSPGSVYGRDTRPVDGRLLQITYQNRSIYVGDTCASTQGCRAIPPGVAKLRDLLTALAKQEVASPTWACD